MLAWLAQTDPALVRPDPFPSHVAASTSAPNPDLPQLPGRPLRDRPLGTTPPSERLLSFHGTPSAENRPPKTGPTTLPS